MGSVAAARPGKSQFAGPHPPWTLTMRRSHRLRGPVGAWRCARAQPRPPPPPSSNTHARAAALAPTMPAVDVLDVEAVAQVLHHGPQVLVPALRATTQQPAGREAGQRMRRRQWHSSHTASCTAHASPRRAARRSFGGLGVCRAHGAATDTKTSCPHRGHVLHGCIWRAELGVGADVG